MFFVPLYIFTAKTVLTLESKDELHVPIYLVLQVDILFKYIASFIFPPPVAFSNYFTTVGVFYLQNSL